MSTEDIKQKWMQDFEVVFGEDVETKESTEFSKLLEASRPRRLHASGSLKASEPRSLEVSKP